MVSEQWQVFDAPFPTNTTHCQKIAAKHSTSPKHDFLVIFLTDPGTSQLGMTMIVWKNRMMWLDEKFQKNVFPKVMVEVCACCICHHLMNFFVKSLHCATSMTCISISNLPKSMAACANFNIWLLQEKRFQCKL